MHACLQTIVLLIRQYSWPQTRMLFAICLLLLSIIHLVFGFGNLFQCGPLYNVSWCMVNGRPSTGETGVERLLEIVFGLWYTGSIVGALLAYFFGSTAAMQGALVSPIFYHVFICIAAALYFDKYKICNPVERSGRRTAVKHAWLGGMCVFIYWSL